MRFNRFVALILAILLSAVMADSIAATVAQSTSFTYQGQLNAGGTLPAGQTYQFTFALYDAASGGNVVGPTIKQAILVGNGGLFTTDLDFGQILNGTQYWLDIQVGTTTLNEQELATRQPINAAPVAQYALNTPPSTFAEFYHSYDDAGFPVGVSPGGGIPFPNAGPASGSPITPFFGGPPDFYFGAGLQVPLSGTYEVSFEVSTSDAGGNSLQLEVNQYNLLPYTLVSLGTKTLVGKFLVNLYAGDQISLVNANPSSTLHLDSSRNGATNANIVIKLLH